MSYFSPYANFSCPYLKIGLCNMFPVLLDCITNVNIHIDMFDYRAPKILYSAANRLFPANNNDATFQVTV